MTKQSQQYFYKKLNKFEFAMSSVGDRIKKIRGTLTQKEFADNLGITPQAVINYERHGRIPSRSILNKISTVYTVTVDWLLTGEGPMNQIGVVPDENEPKTCNMSQVLQKQNSQHSDFTTYQKKETCDVSQVLALQQDLLHTTRENAALQRDLLESVRQNGDLRVEVERQRARIAELERQLAEALKPQGGQTLLGQRGAAAG